MPTRIINNSALSTTTIRPLRLITCGYQPPGMVLSPHCVAFESIVFLSDRRGVAFVRIKIRPEMELRSIASVIYPIAIFRKVGLRIGENLKLGLGCLQAHVRSRRDQALFLNSTS